jgi:osmotically-inducible protein OsmY
VSSTTTTSASMDSRPEPSRHGVATFLDDNQGLTRRVEAVLASDPALSQAAGDVNVSTDGNIVTLSGTTTDYASLDAIEAAVRQMPGVSRVYTDVHVSPTIDQRQIDENIAFSLQRSLSDQPRVSIEVVRGVVMLRGEASASSDYVQRVAERTPGVRAVVNNLSEPAEENGNALVQ